MRVGTNAHATLAAAADAAGPLCYHFCYPIRCDRAAQAKTDFIRAAVRNKRRKPTPGVK